MTNPQQPELPQSAPTPYTYSSPSEQNSEAENFQPQTLPQYYKNNPVLPTISHADDENSIPKEEMFDMLTGADKADKKKNSKEEKKTVDPLTTKKGLTRFVLNVLYGSLILSALIGIGAIMFGNDTYGGNAAATIGLLIVVDLVLLLGLIPRIPVYRYSMWFLGILAFILSTIAVWLPKGEVFYNEYYPYDVISRPKNMSEIFAGTGGALWLFLATISILALVSVGYGLVEKVNKTAVVIYWVMHFVAVIGTIPLAIALAGNRYVGQDSMMQWKIYLSAFVLSATLLLILSIAVLHNVFTKQMAEKKKSAQMVRSLSRQGQSAHTQNTSSFDNPSPHSAAVNVADAHTNVSTQEQQTALRPTEHEKFSETEKGDNSQPPLFN